MSKSKFRAQSTLLRLAITAMLIALSIVFCRLLGFSPAGTPYRVEIGFLPIALVGMLYGPFWSMLAYALADLIGSVLTTGMNPFILLCKALFGLLLGLALYTKRPQIPAWEFILRAVICLVTVAGAVDIAIMSPIFVYMGYSANLPIALADRAINAAVNLPIRIGVLIAAYFPLRRLVARYKTKGVFHL